MQVLSYFADADTTLPQTVADDEMGVILHAKKAELLNYEVICEREKEPERYEELKRRTIDGNSRY